MVRHKKKVHNTRFKGAKYIMRKNSDWFLNKYFYKPQIDPNKKKFKKILFHKIKEKT